VIVVDSKIYKQLGEPSDEENDMLDLAFGLTDTYYLLLSNISHASGLVWVAKSS
jgi:hypothetical protein